MSRGLYKLDFGGVGRPGPLWTRTCFIAVGSGAKLDTLCNISGQVTTVALSLVYLDRDFRTALQKSETEVRWTMPNIVVDLPVSDEG